MNTQTTTNRTIPVSIAALLLIAVSATVARAGETCPTNNSGPDICVAFDGGTPVEDFHFTVDYTTDAANPSVKLKAGSLTWNVRSDDDGSAGNIGTISLDPTVSTANFTVSILTGAGAGVVHAKGIDLTAVSWTGFSNLTGIMSGNLTGDLVLVESSGGSGGTVSFTIEGNVLADITIPHGAGLTIEGNLGNSSTIRTITVDDIDGGNLVIEGSVLKGDIIVNTLIVSGNLDIGVGASWPTNITIEEMRKTGKLRMGYLNADLTLASARVTVNTELPGAGAVLDFRKLHLDSLAEIDFGNNDVDGDILIGRFGGDITAKDLGGTIDIKTRFDNTGLIDLAGSITGNGEILINSDEDSAGVLGGDIDVGRNMTGTATITVFDDGAGGGGDLAGAGSIAVHGTTGIGVGAKIEVEGDAAGLITVDDDLLGVIDIDGDLSGDVTIDGGMGSSALVSIGGDVTGDVDVAGDSDTITITGGLVDVGRVLVGGEAKDGITLGMAICPSALVRVVGGLASTGYIEMDPDTTNCTALGDGGDIQIGNGGDVIFHPSAYILISDGAGGGDWDGDIKVTGCFTEDPGANVEICVCGTMTGAAWVSQPGICDPIYEVDIVCGSLCD